MIFWNFIGLRELEFVKHFDKDYEIIDIITHNRINSDFNACILVTHAHNCFGVIFYIYEHTELNNVNLYSGKATFDEEYNLCKTNIFTIREFVK